MSCVVVALLLVALCWAQSSNSSEFLNIHIIAHTHDDVGWLKTVDEYFLGANNSIQDAGVQYILDSLVLALEANPARRFVYVEIAFFARWWNEQDNGMKARVRALVANKQLEFVNGGWCMNDEAGTHYESTIEQMALGHAFLMRELGIRPTIGWHIDPFGHSNTQATLFAAMGFSAFFFARIDYQDYATRNASRTLEMVWRSSQSLGGQSDMFTHVLYDTTYCYPRGFAFGYGDPPINDDERIEGYNVVQEADAFAALMRERRLNYRTNDIFVTFGCDFQYENANINFKNMDKLMAYMNARQSQYNMTLFYSTPQTYVDTMHAKNLTWSLKTDDFFPYADMPHAYWTGYMTSRPALKFYVRHAQAVLNAATRAVALANTPTSGLAPLAAAVGVTQHHDAVAGTEKQHVADDYARQLAAGIATAHSSLATALGQLMRRNASTSPPLAFCTHLNVSQCAPIAAAHGQYLPVVLFNTLATQRATFVRLPVAAKTVGVVAPDGTPVAAQFVPNPDTNQFTVVFPVALPPLGFATYFIDLTSVNLSDSGVARRRAATQPSLDKSSSSSSSSAAAAAAAAAASIELALPTPIALGNAPRRERYSSVRRAAAAAPSTTTLENGQLRLTFNTTSMLLMSIENLVQNTSVAIEQNFFYYNASTGNNVDSDQPSGAYIFRPNQSEPYSVCVASQCNGVNRPLSLDVTRGPWVVEARQVWGTGGADTFVVQTTRLYADAFQFEQQSDVGPIPIDDGRGKEIIMRFTSNIASNDLWYTDAQGGEMQQRRRNYRATWPFKVNEPVAGNYVPKNSAAYIEDAQSRLTVVTDRSSGCASLQSGAFEMMLHRRLLVDDHRGVGEALNETNAIRAQSIVQLAAPDDASRLQRQAALEINAPVQYAFGKPIKSPTVWLAKYVSLFAPLARSLPPNVELLTFTKMSVADTYLIRLHHVFAVNEDSVLSGDASVDLSKLFNHLAPTRIDELSLTATVNASSVTRLQWNSPGPVPGPQPWPPQQPHDYVIRLHPTEFRTFAVKMIKK